MAEVYVQIEASIGGDLILLQTGSAGIPPDYDQQDIDALVVRTVEDTAFDAVQAKYGRAPTRRALVAAAARLIAAERLLDDLPEGSFRNRLITILGVSNEEAIARWAADPEGG